MSQPDICINSSGRSINSSSSGRSSRDHTSRSNAKLSNASDTQLSNMQTSNMQRSDIQLDDLACSFTRISKNGKPALLASVRVRVHPIDQAALPALLRHAQELNIRLSFLKVGVRADIGFILRGFFCGDINASNMSDFLSRLTQDFQTFLTYAKAHEIQLQPTHHIPVTTA